MNKSHPDTWIWLVDIQSDRFDPHRVAVAADDPMSALDVIYARYNDVVSANVVGNGVRLLAAESLATASRKAPES